MLEYSDAARVRRLTAGSCFIAAPVVLLVGSLVHPHIHDGGAGHLAVVRENPERYFAAHAILLGGLILFLPAVLGLLHMQAKRQALAGHVGAGLAIVGMFGAAGIVTLDGVAVSQMGQPEANAQEMAALLDRIKESSGLRIIARSSAVSFVLGMLLLAYGVGKVEAVRPLGAVAIAVAAIVFLVAQITDTRMIFAIAFATYGAAFIPIGREVLMQPDEKWT